MAKLIRSIVEVRAHVPNNMTTDFDKINPFLENAERLYVVHLLGKEEFLSLLNIYIAADYKLENIIDEEVKEAIFIIQKVICNLGFLFGLPLISVSIGSAGIQINSSADKKTAFQWQTDEIKQSLQELGFGAIEQLLDHLELFPDKFSDYIASKNYINQKRFLISTAANFTEYFDIKGSRFLFQSLCTLMYRIEDQVMEKIFGEVFFQSLKSPDASPAEIKLANKYIKPAIALLTGAKSIKERVFSYNDGVVTYNFLGSTQQNLRESKELSDDKINPLVESLTADANAYLQGAKDYINANLTDFPAFEEQLPQRRFKGTNRKEAGIFMT
jgi:hypothetical protein